MINLAALVERLRNGVVAGGDAAAIEALAAENARIKQLEHGYDVLRTALHRAEASLADAAAELPHCSGPIAKRIATYRKDWQERIERAEAERDALRKDAERYRWLREYRGIKLPTKEGKEWKFLFLDDADAAIDAATHPAAPR